MITEARAQPCAASPDPSTSSGFVPGVRGRLLLAAVATALVLGWQATVVGLVYGGNWTGLFHADDAIAGPAAMLQGVYFFTGAGYDGQFYRYIAHDPVFQKGYARFIDDARLRYRRILIPGLAYVLAAGNHRFIDAMYVILIAVSIGFGVYWSAQYSASHQRPAALGLVFLASAASLVSVDRMLLEAPLAALFMGFVVYVTSAQWWRAYAVMALAFLTRETGALFIAAAVLYFCGKRSWRTAGMLATAALPGLTWYAFVWLHTAPSGADTILAFPLWGVVRRLFVVRDVSVWRWKEALFLSVDVAAVLGFLASFAIVGWWIKKDGAGPVQICLALFIALGLVLGGVDHMMDAYGYARPVAPLLAYALLRSVVTGAWLCTVSVLTLSASIGIHVVAPVLKTVRTLVAVV